LVKALEFFRPQLGAEVAIGGRELRVAKKVADEHGVGGSGEEAAGGVSEPVQAHGPEASALAAALIATA
jgi:hypothetical protein